MSKKIAGWLLIVLLAAGSPACTTEAPPIFPKENFIYSETGSMLPVIFSHERHLGTGVTCDTCHPAIFETRRGMADATKRLNMKSIYDGEYCGACHNGTKAFGLEKCSGCHVGSHM